jgi:D-erythro-7,8-dihydroneopterin triphosphate epimerase
MATIRIKNLLLRTEVGFNLHEHGKKQDLLLNIALEYHLSGEEVSDEPRAALDYRDVCKQIIELVEKNRYNLIEKVANDVAELVLSMPRVLSVNIEVDKPHALRFSQSVSFELTRSNQQK